MLAVLLVASAALLGAGLARRAPIAITRLERICLAGAIALTAGPWLAFIAAWLAGFTAGLPLAAAAMAAIGLGLVRAPAGPLLGAPATSRLSWLALAVLFAGLFHGHMFHAEAGGLYTGGASYGDLALHAALANRFAVAEVSFASPLVAGEPLTYPFLGDFAVACLIRGGWPLPVAFAVTGWLSIMIALGLVQALALRLFGRRSAATLAVWLIVLSGSVAGVVQAVADLSASGLPARIGDLPSYSHLRPRGLVFANLVCDFVLPQRALLAALPAFWAAVWALAVGDRARSRKLVIVGGALFGALPFLHVHSFLVGLGLVGWLGLWRGLSRGMPRGMPRGVATRSQLATWSAAFAVAIAIAAPQLAWQFGRSWSPGFGGWDPGWLAPAGGWWWFWLRQWGPALVVLPLVIVWARGDRFVLPLVLAALVVFGAANLYRFQPHDWDNMKFLVYAYMMLAIAIAGWLDRELAAGWLRRLIAAAIVVALTATGALSVAREADLRQELASADDVALAGELARALPPDARVLTSDAHNHVVPMLAGRAIVMGYRGWLWTHGIDYRRLERDVARMFVLDADAPRLFAEHGVSHVYIGPGERKTFHAALDRYRKRYPAVVVRPGVEVFDVRSEAPRPDRAAVIAPL